MKKIKKITKAMIKKKEARLARIQFNKNDKIWKDSVRARDGNTCQVCKKALEGVNNQAHHIIPRQFHTLRHDLLNGINLCYYHHSIGKFSPHKNALWFVEWLKENKKEQYEYLLQKLKEDEDLKNKN